MGIINGQTGKENTCLNNFVPSTKQVAAALAGIDEKDVLAFGIREDGSAVVIMPKGQKLVFTPEQIYDQAEHMTMIATADAARELQIEIDNIMDGNILPKAVEKLPKPVDKLPLKHKVVAGTATKDPLPTLTLKRGGKRSK